jgi:hypothetical protein
MHLFPSTRSPSSLLDSARKGAFESAARLMRFLLASNISMAPGLGDVGRLKKTRSRPSPSGRTRICFFASLALHTYDSRRSGKAATRIALFLRLFIVCFLADLRNRHFALCNWDVQRSIALEICGILSRPDK